jgi:riboflavin biosynthesis pyrimidine reductase
VWIATTGAERPANALGAENARILAVGAGPDGRVDLGALLLELGRRGVRSVMVEGGAQVLTSFVAGQLAQAAVITIAPRLVGGVHALAAVPAQVGGAAPQLASVAYTPAGEDLVVWGDLAWPQSAATARAAATGQSSQKRRR